MKLSERLFRTSMRQRDLGRVEVSNWYWAQRTAVLKSGEDPEHPPLRDVLKRYHDKRSYVR